MIVDARGAMSVDVDASSGLVRVVDERFASASITNLDADQCAWLAADLLEAVKLINEARGV